MEVEYHPLVKRDIEEILEWYDQRSDTAGDRFIEDFEKTIGDLVLGKRQGFFLDANTRKISLRRFPYTVSYEERGQQLFVFVVKHQKRHPELGHDRTRD